MPPDANPPSATLPLLPRIATVLVFGLAGLLLVTTALAARGTDLRAARSENLPQLVRQHAAALAQAQATVDRLAASVTARTGSGGTGPSGATAWQQRIAVFAPSAALTEVSGPGIVVTLDDAPRSVGGAGNVSPDDLVVHQQDVQAVVNAMWRAGASGVSVMGRRLSATSAVRCVGNTLLLDGRVYSPPFRVEAVGDVQRLQSELDSDPQVQLYQEYVDLVGLGWTLSSTPDLTLAPYAGPLPGGDA